MLNSTRFFDKFYSFTVLLLIFLLACQIPSSADQDEQLLVADKILPGAYNMAGYMEQIKDKNIGIVVNHTSTVGKVHLVDTLMSLGISIGAIFSPEHGFKGSADAGEKVTNDLYKGEVPIISLYGDKRKPHHDDLEKLDIMIFDIQDVGVRFYTYISTLHYVMEACSEEGMPLIVLDRPNPNGHYIDGPIRVEKYKSFVGMHPVPIVYGMTIGEYARMILGEGWLESERPLDLDVITCSNYDHSSRYILPIPPSPNLPNERAVLLYPSLCLFEATVYSIGRGTNSQFQVIGHPEYPNEAFSFTPRNHPGAKNPKHKDVECYGIDLADLSPEEIRSWRKINLSYLIDGYKQAQSFAPAFFNSNNFFEKLSGIDELRPQLISGLTEDEIRETWKGGLLDFSKVRSKYLLYADLKN